jgi:hypothetical protein
VEKNATNKSVKSVGGGFATQRLRTAETVSEKLINKFTFQSVLNLPKRKSQIPH